MSITVEKKLLPAGTRIRFLHTIIEGPDEDGPARHMATRGDGGHVTGHGAFYDHIVKWDGWQHAGFGADFGVDFVEEITATK